MTQESPAATPTSEAPVTESATVAPVESAPTETAAPEPAPAPQEDPDFVRRFNALARKEREIRQKEQVFKEQMGEYEAYRKERELLKNNPLDFLEKNGWKFNDLAEYVLNDQKKTPDMQVSELQKRIDQLEAERKAELETKQRSEQEKQNQAAINNFKEKIKTSITENNETYELINHFGEYDLVYEVISNYYANNGQILDVDKAAQEVENYLEQQFEKAAATNKFKKRYNLGENLGQDQQKPSFADQVAKQMSTPPPTLTNDYVANSPSPQSGEPISYLSDEESKAKAADLIRQHFLKKQGYTKQ